MKRLHFLLTILIALVATACGSKQSETVIVDSDSTIAVQEAVLAEQMRIDSLRQDSIRKDSIQQANKFAKNLPNPATLFHKYYETDRGNYLRKLGFKGATKGNPDACCADQVCTGNYKLNGSNGESCNVSWKATCCGREDRITVTINGADAAIDDFFSKAQKLKVSEKGSYDIRVSRSGNKVEIYAAVAYN